MLTGIKRTIPAEGLILLHCREAGLRATQAADFEFTMAGRRTTVAALLVAIITFLDARYDAVATFVLADARKACAGETAFDAARG